MKTLPQIPIQPIFKRLGCLPLTLEKVVSSSLSSVVVSSEIWNTSKGKIAVLTVVVLSAKYW